MNAVGRDPYFDFRDEFEDACKKAGRKPAEIALLPVSKGQSLERIRTCLALPGFPTRLGENYLDELAQKNAAFAESGSGVEWHYLGKLQSRKIREIAELAACIHTVGRTKELDALAPYGARFYLQVNISAEPQKNGFFPDALTSVFERVAELSLSTRCVGLMGMAAPLDQVGDTVVASQFALLRELRDRHLPHGGLSMGMSDDYQLALREGATCVRVGSKIFGTRGA